ncbi:hypothetical protein AGMMS50293_10260 [Spirochaetia bacterium]|nr:hypothetical protein AGMMS50293_10260 [Spirochaetia bacterium]
MKKILFVWSVWFMVNSSFVFAETEFSFRLAPSIVAPLARPEFDNGTGAMASLDWAFFTFADKFDLGVSIGGSYTSLPFETGDPMSIIEGTGGLFIRYRPFDRWAFRFSANAGAYQYSRKGQAAANPLMSFTPGAEFRLSPYFSLFADGAYTYRIFSSEPLPTLGATFGIRLNLSEIMAGRARVQVEKTKQHRVFPVSWAWYERNPIAAVTVTNNEPNAITDMNLTFFIDSYMSEPWTFATVQRLAPGESIELPVTALFNEALLNLNETVTANGILRMQYRSLGARKETTSPIQMPIFRRNILSWDDDRRAAAFVSPRDYSVQLFARNIDGAVEKIRNDKSEMRNVPPDVLYAIGLFEALRLYRISYVVDPSSSYIALSENGSATDSLNYPYETLYYRGGDCDDLSILFCSLLEVPGIESAFITIPGHIYIAFAIEDDTWQPNNSDIITIAGNDGTPRRWLPIEITVPGRGFTQAWRIGARQWRTAGTEAALYPIRDCWETYPSVTVPASGSNPPEVPEWEEIVRAVQRELVNIK